MIKYLIGILVVLLVFYHSSQNNLKSIPTTNIVVPVIDTPKEYVVYKDYGKALEASKTENKLLLVILKTSWCKYCGVLEDDIEKLKIREKFIVCLLDADENKKLAKAFKYKVVPTSVVIDCSGNRNIETSRKEGYIYDDYVDWLQSINHDD